MPFWLFPKLAHLGIELGRCKEFGGSALSNLETGAVLYEMAKTDASFATGYSVNANLGLATIDACGDHE